MENISWVFDGLGTEILSLIVGFISGGAIGYKIGIHNGTMIDYVIVSGGAIGYKIGIHNKVKQSQKAGNNSNQTQIGTINYGSNK